MASNQNVNKVVYAGTTLIDLTGDDVTAGDVLSGKKFHLPSGAEATGTLQVVNRNLLDNWYFVGGGSQLGDGIFPINQRGQTTHSGIAYGIDRWKNGSERLSITVQSSSIRLTRIWYSHAPFGQTVNLPAGTYTLSALYDAHFGNGGFFQLRIVQKDGKEISKAANTQAGFDYYTFTTASGIQEARLHFNPTNEEMGDYVDVFAIKLELGSEQTLCHNEGTEENPVWVLNEVPDYGEELRKCQRYYQLFRTESLRPTYGEDCRPTMATEQPTKGTLTKGGVTYYTLSSES